MALLCASPGARAQESGQVMHKITYDLRNTKIVEGQISEIAHGETFRVKVENAAGSNLGGMSISAKNSKYGNSIHIGDGLWEFPNVTADLSIGFFSRRDALNGYSTDDDSREVYFSVNKMTWPKDSLILKDSVPLQNMGKYLLREVDFEDVDHLRSITFKGYRPPQISGQNKLKPLLGNLKIYVPKGAKQSYLAYLNSRNVNLQIPEADVIELEEGTAPTESMKITYETEGVQLIDAPESIAYGEDLFLTILDEDGKETGFSSGVTQDGRINVAIDRVEDRPNVLCVPAVSGDLVVRITGSNQYNEGKFSFFLYKHNKQATCFNYSDKTATEVTIPGTVTHDGVEYTVTRIDNRFLEQVTDLTIPGGVYDLGSSLDNCKSLKTLKFSSSFVPGIGLDKVFQSVDTLTCKLLVPQGSLEVYKRNAVWGKFKNIEEYAEASVSVSVSNWFDNNVLKVGEECQPLPIYMDFSSLDQDYRLVFEMEDTSKVAIRYGSDNQILDAKPLVFKEGKSEIRKSECRVDTEGGKMRVIPYLAVTPKEAGTYPFTLKVYSESGKTCYGTFPSAFKTYEDVTINTPDSVIKDQEVESITIQQPEENPTDTLSVTLDNVIASSLNVGSETKTELTLTGKNNLGEITNEGTLILSSEEGKEIELKVTSVENQGILTDLTGQVMEVSGEAALQIEPLKDKSVEEGSTIDLTAVATADTKEGISFQWQKWNAEEKAWKDIEKAETKGVASLRAATETLTDILTITSAEVGIYRCLITRTSAEVVTTLSVYSAVTVASSEPEIPVVNYYEVTLPVLDGAITNPEAGSYTVEEGESFSFTVEVEEGYKVNDLVVKANGTTLTSDADGRYTIANIHGDMVVTVSGIVKDDNPTANETINSDELRVWGANGRLFIQTPVADTAYIVTFDGRLYKTLSLPAGEYVENMPQGSYIIYIGKQSYKLKF